MGSDNRGLYRDGASTAVLNLLSKLQSVAAIATGSIAAGLTGVGQIAVVIGASYLGYTIADFGFSSEVGRYIATNPTAAALHQVRTRAIFRMSGAAAVAPAVLWVFSGTKIPIGLLAIIGTSIYAYGLLASGLLSAVSYGLGNFLRSSIATGLVRIVASIISIVVALCSSSFLLCPILFGVGEILISVWLWLGAIKFTSDAAPDPRSAPPISRRHYWLGMASITNTLVNQSDVLVVAAVLTPAELGVFSVGSQLQNGVATLALSTTTPLSIYIARSLRSTVGIGIDSTRSDQSEARQLAKQSLRLTGGLGIMLTIAVSGGFYIYAREFAGTSFSSSAIIAVVLCLSAAVPSACSAVYIAIGVGTNNHEIVGKVRVISGVLALGFILTLSRYFGLIGASVGTVARDLVLLALTSTTVSYAIWRGKPIRFITPNRESVVS